MVDFSGFPKEMIKFFGQLEKNNKKEWFDRHREDYYNNELLNSLARDRYATSKLLKAS